MNLLRKTIFILAIAVFVLGCNDDEKPTNQVVSKQKVLILGEGQFQKANASLSGYNPESKELDKDLFFKANGYRIGDILNHALIDGDKLYLVVNNSNKLLILDANNYVVINSIDINQPRRIIKVDNAFYISSFSGLYKLDGTSNNLNKISSKSSDQITQSEDKIWFANYSDSFVFFMNKSDNKLDSVKTARNNVGLMESQGNIFALCTKDFNGSQLAQLFQISTSSYTSSKIYEWKENESVSKLFYGMDKNLLVLWGGNQLLEQKDDQWLPLNISNDNWPQSIYGIKEISDNEWLVSDAGDFVNESSVYHFKGGELFHQLETGVAVNGFVVD